jgi:hypothetical protein
LENTRLCPLKYIIVWGEGGTPMFFYDWNPNIFVTKAGGEYSYFCYLRPHVKFGTLGQLFKIPLFSAQKSHSARGRGDPNFFFMIGILMLLRSHAKLQNPRTTPSGRISNEPEREKNAIYSGHLRLCLQPKDVR